MASAWIRKLFRNATHSTIRKARLSKPAVGRRPLRIESLEDRVVPAIIIGLDPPYDNPFTVNEGPGVVIQGTWFDNNAAATVFNLTPTGLPSNITFGGFSYTTDTVAPRSGTFSFTLTPLDGTTNPPGVPPISSFGVVGSNDKAQTSSTESVEPRVQNVAPSFTSLPPNQVAFTNQSKTYNLGAFTDPGADNPWTVEIDWDNNGSFEDSFSAGAKGQLNTTHKYTSAGPQTVNVRVVDK